MNIGIFLAGVILLTMLPLVALGENMSRPSEEIDPALVRSLSGKWAVSSESEGCETGALHIRFSDDQRYMYIEHGKPYMWHDQQINLTKYLLLYSEGSSITMYIEGEDRRTKQGDRVIWLIILKNPSEYAWRRYD